jgi:enoyl-[acyl-carrier-protein] reductase (NADH)
MHHGPFRHINVSAHKEGENSVTDRIAIVTGRAVAVGADVSNRADVAHTISFLVSEGAGFVSGQVIYVAGGPLC